MAHISFLSQSTPVDTNGNPYAGGLLYFYETGTTTPLDTYSNETLASANANPVVANSAGLFGAIYLKPQVYKVVLKTSAGVTVWTLSTLNGAVHYDDKGADVSSATATTLPKTGSSFDITGTTTISSFVGHGVGTVLHVHFDSILTLTHSASALILPGARNIQTAAGDEMTIQEYSAGNFRCLSYSPADGKALARTEHNGLHNGGFAVAQRGTAFTAATVPINSDDTYLLDRWVLLSDTNDIVDVSRETSVVPTGSYAACKSLVATAEKKWGFLQVLEAADSARFIGGICSLQFKARTTSGSVVENIRAGVISWSSTADAVTSDVVSAWGNEGTNPTLASNWAFENTPANLAVTAGSYSTHRIEAISIDTSSTANIGVFIWVDDTDCATGDLLYITDVQLDLSPRALTYESLPIADELARCQRYYEQSYDVGTAPGTSTEVGAIQFTKPVATGDNFVRFVTTKRATAPTCTTYSTTGASGKYRDLTSGADFVATVSDHGMTGFHVAFAASGAADEIAAFQYTASSDL